MTKPTLVIDFDGCLNSYASGWKGASVILDPPVPGAMEFLNRALDHFKIEIFSSRSGQPEGIYAMRKWLRKHWLEADLPGDREMLIEWPVKKPAAFLTIDDRAIQFDGNWNALDPVVLLEFKPWNKRARQTSAAGASAEGETTHAEHPGSDRIEPQPG